MHFSSEGIVTLNIGIPSTFSQGQTIFLGADLKGTKGIPIKTNAMIIFHTVKKK